MFFTDAFLVTAVKPVTRPGSNLYTGGGDRRQDAWLVHVIDGFLVGFYIDMFFETRDGASRFAPFEVLPVPTLIQRTGAETPFVVGSIDRQYGKGAPNFWTGAPQRRQQSVVRMSCPTGPLQGLNLGFPCQSDALQYRLGSPYTIADLFGTWPAAPYDVAQKLAQLAEVARLKAQSRQTAPPTGPRPGSAGLGPGQASGLIEGQQPGPGVEPPPAPPPPFVLTPQEAAAEIAGARELGLADYRLATDFGTYKADIEEALAAQSKAEAQVAAQVYREMVAQYEADLAAYAAAYHPNGAAQVMPAWARWWYLWGGGATGYYDGTYYPKGTFPVAIGYLGPNTDTGIPGTPGYYSWFGVFSLNNVTPAPPGIYTD